MQNLNLSQTGVEPGIEQNFEWERTFDEHFRSDRLPCQFQILLPLFLLLLSRIIFRHQESKLRLTVEVSHEGNTWLEIVMAQEDRIQPFNLSDLSQMKLVVLIARTVR